MGHYRADMYETEEEYGNRHAWRSKVLTEEEKKTARREWLAAISNAFTKPPEK